MSTKRLYVLRHAKSSWDDPLLADHDRPLADRGHRAVAMLADHVAAEGIAPEVVLCSTARRARETLVGVLGDHVAALVEPELYGADCRALVARLNRIPDEVASVLLVGHNPASQQLVLFLASDDAPPLDGEGEPSLAQIAHKFPTGALATLDFNVSWSQLGEAEARLTAYVRPKSLG